MDCIFCKIVAGEIPSTKVYEDDKCVAFLDIRPMSLGHTLVIPKLHAEQLSEIPTRDLGAVLGAVQKVSNAIFKGLKAEGVNVLQSNGRAAGQEVAHVHFHLIPRKRGDGLNFYPPKKDYTAEETKMAETSIRDACKK